MTPSNSIATVTKDKTFSALIIFCSIHIARIAKQQKVSLFCQDYVKFCQDLKENI